MYRIKKMSRQNIVVEDEELFTIDMHVHSEASFDGKEPVELILEQASDIGLDAVVVTDHDEIEASLEAKRKAEDHDLVGISGVEVSTKHGHLLAIGVDEMPEKGLSYEETMKEVRELGGVAVAPHPFQRSRHGVKKRRIGLPDAIETLNAWFVTGYRNKKAKKFADKKEIPGVAASDAHSIATIGKAYTAIEFEDDQKPVDEEDIIRELRENEHRIKGRRVPLHKSLGHFAKAVLRKASYIWRKLFRS